MRFYRSVIFAKPPQITQNTAWVIDFCFLYGFIQGAFCLKNGHFSVIFLIIQIITHILVK